MKKILLFAIVAMMSLVVNAQVWKVNKDLKLPVAKMSASVEGADIWGYYLGDESGIGGLGTQSAGTFGVAIMVPGNGVLNGAKIQGINLPVNTTKMSNVTVFGGTTLGSSNLFSKSVTITKTGYQTITLDDEVNIPNDGMYVGYKFTISSVSTQAEQFPMGVVQDEAAGSLYLSLDGKNYSDYSSAGYGVSALQLFVSGMVLPDNGATVSSVQTEACAVNGTGTAVVYLSSNGKNGVSNVDYTLTVNEVVTTGTATLSPAIPGGLNKTGMFEVSYTAPAEIGSFPASIAINSVNGQPNEFGTEPVAFTVNTVSRVVPRMTVIEEFTGTGCGYCPRGWVGMEAVKHNQSDKALVIAWHSYNSSDAMYQANYAAIPFDGAPQCTVDRKVYPDPYYGEGEEGIMECVNKYNTATPTVDITKLSARFSEDNKTVSISSDTEFLTNTNGYTIAYVLTADELTGTTTAWKQSNYYSSYTVAQAGVMESMPDLAKFCKNGEYGKSSVQLVFNDAMIGSTYNSTGRTLVPAFRTGQAGDVESSEYTLNMPTKASLVNALNYDKVYVTALVIDNNGQIANAKRVRVLGAGEPDPTPDPVPGNGIISPRTEVCQLVGEGMSPNTKYVVGVNFATYAPAAWNTETGDIVNFADYEEGAFHAANNNGIFVGDNGVGDGYAIKADAQGNVTELYRFVGEEVETEWGTMSTGDAGSAAWTVSEDGKFIAGYYFDSAYKTTPCFWNENNERIDLPLPTSEEAGFYADGGEVRWMSEDGKILAGFLIDNFGTWPACIWRQNAQGGYDVDPICKDFWEEGYQQGKPYMVFNPSGISANGEWLALSVQREFDDWDFSVPAPAMQIARLNLNTKVLEVLDDEAGYAPTSIANDGTMLAYTGANDMMGRSGYLWEAGKTSVIALDDILVSAGELEGVLNNTPCTITSDGKKVQGYGITSDESADFFSYIIDVTDIADGIENATVQINKISSDKIFNLQGQQVKGMNARGLYIQGGKKILK